MRTLLRNLLYGLRGLRRRPGMAAAIIATIAIGIGATTAIYTIVYAVLIAPLPYPNANQLMVVWSYVNGHRDTSPCRASQCCLVATSSPKKASPAKIPSSS